MTHTSKPIFNSPRDLEVGDIFQNVSRATVDPTRYEVMSIRKPEGMKSVYVSYRIVDMAGTPLSPVAYGIRFPIHDKVLITK